MSVLVSTNMDRTMNRAQQNRIVRPPQARVEALPLPSRGAPKALLSVMGLALTMAVVASQVLPLVLGS